MNVLIVAPRFAPDIGGVETHVAQLAAHLSDRGVDVTVLTLSDRAAAREETMMSKSGSSFRVVRSRTSRWSHPELPNVRFAVDVVKLSKAADVVHVHSYHRLSSLIAAACSKKPLVASFHYHGGGHTRFRDLLHRIYRPAGRWLVGRCSKVIANSRAEASLLRRDFDTVLRSEPYVIPNGTSVPGPAEPFPTGAPVVLSVCRLEAYKHVDTLIEAKRRSAGSWDLVIVGDGPERTGLEAAAVPGVTVLGHVTDEELDRWWATADLVVSASTKESFGLTVATALAAGVRCVASDIPSHRELVEMSGAGVLVDGHDPDVWAATIDTTLLSPPPRPGRIPGWSDVAVETEAVYRQAR